MTVDQVVATTAAMSGILVGGEVAADELTGALSPASVTLHALPGDAKRIAVALRLRPFVAGEPRVVLQDRWMPSLDGSDGRAHPILVRAELLALGSDRLREVADLLRDDVVLPGIEGHVR